MVTNVGIPTTPLQVLGLEVAYLQSLLPSSHSLLFYVFVFSPVLQEPLFLHVGSAPILGNVIISIETLSK